MGSPFARAALQRQLLLAAVDGNLSVFKMTASALAGGNGGIREAVEAVRGDYGGGGALHAAAAHGRTLVCAYLVEELQMDVNAVAESVRSSNNVAYLLDHDADPSKPTNHGCTPLHTAAGKGICVMAELLLSKGADVNSLSHLRTPLHIAAMESQGAVMKILLDYNADCNKEFATIFTPLFNALKAHSLSCVKLLIKAGADVTKGICKFTPLILAVHDGLTDFYECLLEVGADPNAPDEDDPVYKMNLADLKLEGSKAYKRKDYDTAVKLYTMAIMKSDPSDATLFSNRSICYLKLGEGENALIDAEACWIAQPHWPKACYRKGAAHMLLKDYEKARDAFLDGLKLDPTNAEMEKALREALNSLKISRATTKLSELPLAQKNIMQD